VHAFRRLLLTEYRNRRNVLWMLLCAHILLNITLIFLTAHTPTDQLSYLMTLNIALLCAMLLLPFLRSFSIWRDEWKHRSIYQLFVLPVPRAYLLLTKSLAILLEACMIFAITVISLWIQYKVSHGHLFRAEPLITFDGPKLLFVCSVVLSAISIVLLCAMSLFIGQWIGKFPLLLTFLSFFSGLFIWLMIFTQFPQFITALILTSALGGLNHFLLEKKVYAE